MKLLKINSCDECPHTCDNYDHGHEVNIFEIPELVGTKLESRDYRIYGCICIHDKAPKFPKNFVRLNNSFKEDKIIKYFNIKISKTFPDWCPLEDYK